jgi:ribosomal protein L19E
MNWPRFTQALKTAVQKSLLMEKIPLIPRRKSCLTKIRQAKANLAKFPSKKKIHERTYVSQKSYAAAKIQHSNEECLEFFSSLYDFYPNQRWSQTFKYIKESRLQKNTQSRRNSQQININSFCDILNSIKGAPIASIEESDLFPLLVLPQTGRNRRNIIKKQTLQNTWNRQSGNGSTKASTPSRTTSIFINPLQSMGIKRRSGGMEDIHSNTHSKNPSSKKCR